MSDQENAKGQDKTREEIEQLYDKWFYKFATEEPDGTYTLVIHEVHDGDAYTKFEQLMLKLVNKAELDRVVAELRDLDKDIDNTVMILTKDLPSLLEQDRVFEIRQQHKKEIHDKIKNRIEQLKKELQ